MPGQSPRPRLISIAARRGRIQVDAWPTGTPGLMVTVASYAVTHTATGKALGSWMVRDAAQSYAASVRGVCDWTDKRPAVQRCGGCVGEGWAVSGGRCEPCGGFGLVPREVG